VFHFLYEPGFKLIGIGNHFAGGYLLIAGAVITEFADPEATFGARAHWRPKGPAGHGASGIKIAPAGFRVERRAGFLISKSRKALQSCFIFGENSACGITREISFQSVNGAAGPLPDARRTLGITSFEFIQSGAESRGIKLRNGKWTDAALGATGPAYEPWTALPCGLRQGGVHNLDQFLVAGGNSHLFTLTQPGSR
jgi:hypothetical protein